VRKKYKSPLAFHIAWHPDFKQGLEIADYLYSSFSRNTETPLNRGIGIPIYYYSVPAKGKIVPRRIKVGDADYNAIIVLIDDCLIADGEWNKFVANIKTPTNKHTILFPVACSQHALNLKKLSEINFIDIRPAKNIYTKKELCSSKKKLRSRLLHGICRFLLSKDSPQSSDGKRNTSAPVRLFISHAKKDSEKEASKFRDYVSSETKLKTFFDVNDIADGNVFEREFKNAIEAGPAAFVAFRSDSYAASKWCQIEVLIATRYKSPMVVVHYIKIGEGRSFPYLGNVPTIRYAVNKYNEITDLVLYQVLINIYQRINLIKIKNLYLPKNIASVELASPPELFNLIDVLNGRKASDKDLIVLYPDPPLSIHELKVLNDMGGEVEFLTPIELSRLIK
jgi:hypothetical protein